MSLTIDNTGSAPAVAGVSRGGADASSAASPPVIMPVPPASKSGHTPAAQSGAATEAQFQSAVDRANQEMAQSGQKMEFVYDKSINRTIVKVVDTQTNKVLRQIPAESMLVTARALAERPAKGALIDHQA